MTPLVSSRKEWVEARTAIDLRQINCRPRSSSALDKGWRAAVLSCQLGPPLLRPEGWYAIIADLAAQPTVSRMGDQAGLLLPTAWASAKAGPKLEIEGTRTKYTSGWLRRSPSGATWPQRAPPATLAAWACVQVARRVEVCH